MTPLCKTCGCTDPNNFYRRGKDTTTIRKDICKSCANAAITQKAIGNKVALVAYKGGKCECCGQSFHYSVFEFCFGNVTGKRINMKSSLDKLKSIVDGCKLLCSNCHRTLREGRSNRGQTASESTIYIINNQLMKKLKAIEYKGGRCQCCNRLGPKSIFDFHHVDPNEKEMEWKKMSKLNIEFRNKELDKCILVCSNCHRLIHAGEIVP